MRIIGLLFLTSLVGVQPALAQTNQWSDVSSLTVPNAVRVRGGRVGRSYRVSGLLHSVDDTQVTVAVRRAGKVELVKFDQFRVETVELVMGNPNEGRKRGLLRGMAVGIVLAAIGTVGAIRSEAEAGAAGLIGMYGITVGGGAGIGALMSSGDGTSHMMIYRR